MPLILWQAFSWLSSGWVALILPLVKKIPWQVWAGIATVIAVLYYGHVREARGFDKCQAEVKVANDKEATRRLEAANESIAEANTRAQESASRASQLQEELNETSKQVAKLKNASTVCIPRTITDRFNKPRSVRNIR